jgi:glycosyltransferase involved in cell wall biosynthesis
MTPGPTVSVIIPTYNRSYIIEGAIKSVLAQTYPAYEIVVVDDGSSDDTSELLKRYSGHSGNVPYLRYVRQTQQGKSTALNHGIAQAKGEWIAFLDSDDTWLPQKLEWQIRAIEHFQGKCDACFTDARYINNAHLQMTAFERAGKRHQQLLAMICDPIRLVLDEPHGILVPTLIVRATRMHDVGDFDPKLQVLEDHDFIFRLAQKTNLCLVNLPLVEVDRSANRPVGLIELLAKEEFQLQQRQYVYEKWLRLGNELESVTRRKIYGHLQSVHSAWTNLFLANQDYKEARESVSRAVRHRVTFKLAIKWILTKTTPRLARRLLLQREWYETCNFANRTSRGVHRNSETSDASLRK